MMTNDMHEDDELLRELFQRSESQPDDDLKQKIMQEITVKKEVFELITDVYEQLVIEYSLISVKLHHGY